MPDFIVTFLQRYGLDAADLIAKAGFVIIAVQWVKQYIPQIQGYWTIVATVLLSIGVSFMAYGLLGYQSVICAGVGISLVAIVGKGTVNQFVPGKSVKDQKEIKSIEDKRAAAQGKDA